MIVGSILRIVIPLFIGGKWKLKGNFIRKLKTTSKNIKCNLVRDLFPQIAD